MAQINLVTPIATSIAIAKSEWKRDVAKANELFKWWKRQYPKNTELDWIMYSGRQGIRTLVAKHVWAKYSRKKRLPQKTGTPYEQLVLVKLVSPITQAVDQAKSELKREGYKDGGSKRKKPYTPPYKRNKRNQLL